MTFRHFGAIYYRIIFFKSFPQNMTLTVDHVLHILQKHHFYNGRWVS